MPVAFVASAASHEKVQTLSNVIWFIGAGVWWFDAVVNLHYGARTHALIALAVSGVFLGAGLYFRSAGRRR